VAAEGGDTRVQEHLQYVNRNWVDGCWRPATWSVFCQPVCTNDVEGWHYHRNAKASHGRLKPSGRSQAAKRYLVHFGLRKCYFSLFTATSLWEAQMGQHIPRIDAMLHFFTICTICYLCCSDCSESVSHRLTTVTCDHKVTIDNK